MIPLLVGRAMTILYSLKPDYSVTLAADPKELAHAIFDPSINRTGWNRLIVVSNPAAGLSLAEEYRAAGFLEGFVTQPFIFDHFRNYLQGQLQGENLPPALYQFVNRQISFIEDMHSSFDNPFWNLAYATLQQLRGLHEGYQSRIIKDHNYAQNMPRFAYFYYLTNMGDLNDLLPAFDQNFVQHPECNNFIKMVDGNLLFGHSTFNLYYLMQRVLKTYSFAPRSQYHAKRITFSSRPGDLTSKDDFFIADSGLVVGQTSLNNFNKSNYGFYNPQSLPSWVRKHVALRLANSTDGWAAEYSKFRSGTHNDQWTIVNYNCLRSNCTTPIAYLFEQFFYLSRGLSLDQILIENKYFASYNVPFDPAIYNVSGYSTDYYHDSRYFAFKAANLSIVDVQSLKSALRTVDENDLTGGIAPRYDLKNGLLFGGIDSKVVDSFLLSDGSFWAVSSPPYSGGVKPFSWGDWRNVTARHGMPDVWNFGWLKYNIAEESAQAAN